MELTDDFISAVYNLVVDDSGNLMRIIDEYGNVICDVIPEQIEMIPYKYSDDTLPEEQKARFDEICGILESSSSLDEAFPDFDIYLENYISYHGVSRPLSGSDLELFYLYYINSDDEFKKFFDVNGTSCTFKLDIGLSQDTFVMAAQYINGELIIDEPDAININEYGELEITYLGSDIESFYDTGYTLLIKERDRQTPTITFNSTTGTFSDSTTTKSVQIELSGTTSLSSIIEAPVKPSYKLSGWSTTEGGSVEYLPDATPTIDVDTTLYAVWELRDDIGIIQFLLDTSDATAIASDIALNKTAYVDGEKIIGTYVEPQRAYVTTEEGMITSHCSGKYHYGDISLSKEPKILVFYKGSSKLIYAIYFSEETFRLQSWYDNSRMLGFYQVENSTESVYTYSVVSPSDHANGSGVYTNLPLFRLYSMAPDASPSEFKYTAYYWD